MGEALRFKEGPWDFKKGIIPVIPLETIQVCGVFSKKQQK